MKVLIIAAHPDDEVLGMGGTIKKLTKNGNDVKVIFLATGIFARRSNDYKNKPLQNWTGVRNGSSFAVQPLHPFKAAFGIRPDLHAVIAAGEQFQ